MVIKTKELLLSFVYLSLYINSYNPLKAYSLSKNIYKKSLFLFFNLCFFNGLSSGQNLDLKILFSLNSSNSTFLQQYSRIHANSVTPASIGVPALLYCWGALKKNDSTKYKSLYIASSLILTSVIATSIKYSFKRTRPFIDHPGIIKRSVGGSPSFPSGHTSSSFALATSLTLSHKKWYIYTPAYLWAAGVAYSRVYQGVHYPSDVLCGAIIGSSCAIACYYLNKRILKNNTKRN